MKAPFILRVFELAADCRCREGNVYSTLNKAIRQKTAFRLGVSTVFG